MRRKRKKALKRARQAEKRGKIPNKQKVVTRLWKRQNGLCKYCNMPMVRDSRKNIEPNRRHLACTVDHVFPKSKGGSGKPENLVLACKACNSIKGDAVGMFTMPKA